MIISDAEKTCDKNKQPIGFKIKLLANFLNQKKMQMWLLFVTVLEVQTTK